MQWRCCNVLHLSALRTSPWLLRCLTCTGVQIICIWDGQSVINRFSSQLTGHKHKTCDHSALTVVKTLAVVILKSNKLIKILFFFFFYIQLPLFSFYSLVSGRVPVTVHIDFYQACVMNRLHTTIFHDTVMCRFPSRWDDLCFTIYTKVNLNISIPQSNNTSMYI